MIQDTNLVERTLLNLMLSQDEYAHEITKLLKPEWFLHDSNRKIYMKLLDIYAKHGSLEYALVAANITAEEASAVMLDAEKMPSRVSLIPCINMLSEAHRNRSILRVIERMQTKPEISHISELEDIFKKYETVTEEVQELSDVLFRAITQLENRKPEDFIQSGFPTIDSVLVGYRAGEVYTFGARPGGGKTSFMTQMTLNMARQKRKVLFFGMEMHNVEIVLGRLVPQGLGIATKRLRAASGINVEIKELKSRFSELADLPITLCQAEFPTIEKIQYVTQKVAPDIVIVDYLQRADLPPDDTMRLRVGKMVKGLGALARKQKLPLILVSALSREAEKNDRPRMSDLSESSEIERESHSIVLMWMDPANQSNESPSRKISAFFAKNRSGPQPAFELELQKSNARVTEISRVLTGTTFNREEVAL